MANDNPKHEDKNANSQSQLKRSEGNLNGSKSLPNLSVHPREAKVSSIPHSSSAGYLFDDSNSGIVFSYSSSDLIQLKEYKETPATPNRLRNTEKRNVTPKGAPKERVWSSASSAYWILQYRDTDEFENEIIKRDGNDEGAFEAKYDLPDLQHQFQSHEYDPPIWTPRRRPQKFLDFFMLCQRRRRRRVRRHVDARLFIPTYRSKFLCKVMLVKAVKWLVASSATLSAPYCPAVMDYVKRNVWILMIPVITYLVIYTLVRHCESHLSTGICIFAIIIYTCCIATITTVLYSAMANALVPTVLLTLTCSYIAMAMLTNCAHIDITRDSAVSSVVLLIMSISLMAFVVGYKITNVDEKHFGGQFGAVWLPSFIFTLSLSLMEMAEAKALLQGYSINFGPNDWVVVATLLV